MEPVTGAVVAIVLWAVVLFGCWALVPLLTLVGLFFGNLFDTWDGAEWGGLVGMIFGYLAAIGLSILSLIQGILQIIRLIELLTGGS